MQWLTQNLSEISDTEKKKLKNSNIKISERPKKIKESNDSLLRNY